MEDPSLLIVAIVLLGVFLIVVLVFGFFLGTWIRALLSGVPVSLFDLIGMRMRGTPAKLVVDALIVLRHGGVSTTAREVESLYLAHKESVASAGDLVQIVLDQKEPKA
jgi:uncharacterized protein YqfA (UPF0365 family)